MSPKWLSVLLQAAVVVLSVGGFWLFLELNNWDTDRIGGWWLVEALGFLTLLVACLGLWLVRTYFPPPTWEDIVG